jgi:hypothetical protein
VVIMVSLSLSCGISISQSCLMGSQWRWKRWPKVIIMVEHIVGFFIMGSGWWKHPSRRLRSWAVSLSILQAHGRITGSAVAPMGLDCLDMSLHLGVQLLSTHVAVTPRRLQCEPHAQGNSSCLLMRAHWELWHIDEIRTISSTQHH